MDPNKIFEDLTWPDLTIVEDALRAVRKFEIRTLKHKDLWTVCSRLQIKGVKNASKEAMLQKIVSIYNIKERYGKPADNYDFYFAATKGSASALTGWWTSCSLIGLLRDLHNLGMSLIGLHFMLEKDPTISYFGKECKKHSKVKMKHTTTFALQRMRFSVNFITLTLADLSLIAGNNFAQCGRNLIWSIRHFLHCQECTRPTSMSFVMDDMTFTF